MATDRPLTAAFNEMNDLILGQQRFNAEQKINDRNWAIQSVMLDEQLKDMDMKRENMQLSMDGQRIQNELSSLALKDRMEYETPRDFSVFPIMGRNFFKSQEAVDAVKTLFAHKSESGAAGITIDKTDGSIYADGERQPFSGRELEPLVPHLDFIRRGYDDSASNWMIERDRLGAELAGFEKEKKGISKRPIPEQRIATNKLMNAMQGHKARIKELDTMLTPKNLQSHYAKEAAAFNTMAMQMASRRMPQAASFYNQRAAHFANLEQKILESRLGAGAGGKWAPQMKNIYDTRPDSPNYNKAIGAYTWTPGQGPVPAAHSLVEGANVGDFSYEKAPKKGDVAAGKGYTDLNINQMQEQVRKSYSDFLPGMKDPGIQGAMNTQHTLAFRLLDTYGPDEKRPNLRAMNESRNIQTQTEMMFWNEQDFQTNLKDKQIREYELGVNSGQAAGVFATMPTNTANSYINALKQNDPQFQKWIAGIDTSIYKGDKEGAKKLLNAYAYSQWKLANINRIDDMNTREILNEYTLHTWKQMYASQLGVDPSTVYTPSDKTRSYAKKFAEFKHD
jgi:hypothetical protein